MKKKVILILVILFTLAILSACTPAPPADVALIKEENSQKNLATAEQIAVTSDMEVKVWAFDYENKTCLLTTRRGLRTASSIYCFDKE